MNTPSLITDILILVCVVGAAITLIYLVRYYLEGVNETFGEEDEHASMHRDGPGLPHHRGRK